MAKSNLTLGRKRGRPLLRRLEQPLYDTNVLENATATGLIEHFRIPVGVAMPVTAVNKTEADTNMQSAGKLGYPNKFLLRGINVELFLPDPTDLANNMADWRQFYAQGLFKLFFGPSKPWLTLPLSHMPTGTALTGRYADADVTGDTEACWIHRGRAKSDEFYNFMVKDKKNPRRYNPIRIKHGEPFHTELTWPNGQITTAIASARVRVFLVGTLFESV